MMSHAPNHFNNNFSSMSCGFPGPSMHRMMPYDMMHGHHGSFFNPSVRFCDPSPMPLSSSSSSMSFNSYNNNSSNNKMNNLSSGKERAKVLFRDILGKSSKSYRDMFLMNEPSFLQLANYAEFNQNDPSDAASSSSKSSIKSTSSSSSSSSSIESIRAQQYPFSKPLSAPSTSITSGPSSSSSSSSSAMVLGSSTTPHRNNVHTPQSQPYGTKKVDVDPKILVSTTSLSTNATSSASITSTTSSSRTGKTKSSSRNDTRFKRFTNRLRTTCDRCTRLKTKCTREHDSDACSRCARGNFQCVFTNQRKRGRVPRSFLQNGHSSSTTFSSSDHDSYLGGSSQHDQSSIGTRDDQGRYIIHDDDDDDDYREEDDEEEISEYEHHPKKVRIVNVKPLNN